VVAVLAEITLMALANHVGAVEMEGLVVLYLAVADHLHMDLERQVLVG
jgi:hypothetical protein